MWGNLDVGQEPVQGRLNRVRGPMEKKTKNKARELNSCHGPMGEKIRTTYLNIRSTWVLSDLSTSLLSQSPSLALSSKRMCSVDMTVGQNGKHPG